MENEFLKSGGLVRAAAPVAERCAVIDAEKANYKIAWMSRLLGVPRSSFYAWRSHQITVQTARAMVTQARNIITGTADLAGGIGRAVLAKAAPAAPAPRLRPQGQIPAEPLEQATAWQTPHLPADHQDHHIDPRRAPARSDTPPAVRDNRQRLFNSPALWLDQAGLQGQAGQVGAAPAPGLFPDPVQVRADGADGDIQLGGDLGVGGAAGDQDDQFPFPGR
jgi:hypothetical protein